jgi:predicted DNA binding CopG/RHH family protein
MSDLKRCREAFDERYPGDFDKWTKFKWKIFKAGWAAARRADDDWRPITSHDGRYIVSRDGQVRRVDGMILKQRKNSDGYMIVRLSKPRTTERVHRLVAEAFIPNLERKPSINHINNKRDDNRVCNLEWCTQSENLSHADRQGRMQRNYWVGKRSPNAKLSREDVEAIKREYANGGVSYLILSNRYKTSKRTIGRIINGESYGPLPDPPRKENDDE